jgi:shikimate dehydrogenase
LPYTSPQAIAELLGDLLAVQNRGGAAAARTIRIGLIGRGIQSSRSPTMHQREGARLGMDYLYALIDFDRLGLGDESLADVVAAAEALGFAGLNVTHPFKQAVITTLTDLAPEASAIGAVNTLVFRDGRREGHNTDCWGFAESFREGMPGSPIDCVIQFGAGGGGAAVAHALLELGTEELEICDTDIARASRLAGQLARRFDRAVSAVTHVETAARRASGIVNATPVGMDKYPGTPFATELLHPRHWIADIVYFPAETELLRVARRLGCRTLAGTGMAVYQAVKAFELFTGIAPDRASMLQHFGAAA